MKSPSGSGPGSRPGWSSTRGSPPAAISRSCPTREPERNLVTEPHPLAARAGAGRERGRRCRHPRRYIYIHGTNSEDRIGQPISAGCVLMRNPDIIELYEQVRVGD